MNKFLTIKLLYFLVLSCFLINACKKQETPRGTYDLFPLKVGNEFYYKYDKQEYHSGPSAHISGIEVWKVADQSEQGNSIKYNVERKLNAISSIDFWTDTTIDYTIRDSINSIRYMEISEDRTSSLITASSFISFSYISIRRYQNTPQFEISYYGGVNTDKWHCWFKADSGLIKYLRTTPPNFESTETLTLDSLKIIQ